MSSPVPELWHPFTQLRGFEPLGSVVRARGAWLELDDGRRVLDGIASWWVNPHGHCHPEITQAIVEQASRFDQVILADFTHEPARDLTAALRRCLPPTLPHVFFSDDGSTAVEAGLKMAWQHQRATDPSRHRLVAFEGAYHGDTLGAMSVGARDVFSAPFHPLLREVTLLPWDDAEAAEGFLAAHGHEVVAVIVEPMVQGAGGMRFGSPAFLRRLADATRAAGALFVADEVATGFGRTGRFWACEHAGVAPDILCMSKAITGGALALGATATTRTIFDSFLGDDKRTAFLHGHSYTGNPLACAAAIASLRLFETGPTVANVRQFEQLATAALPRFDALPSVHGARALGGILAFDVSGGVGGYLDPIGVRIQRAALRRNLYIRPLGHVVYLMPPACLDAGEIGWALDTLYDATAEVVRE